MPKTTLVFGVTYHGSTDLAVTGLDNAFSKHISAQNLQNQLAWLAGRFNILTISEILDRARSGSLPSKTAFVVFHDGYRSNYLTAFPLLKALGLHADFFIPTAFIGTGRKFWVDMLDAALKYTSVESIKLSSDQGEEVLPLHNDAQRLAASQRLRNRLKALPESSFATEFSRIINELGWSDPSDVPKLGDHTMCMDWDQVREMAGAGMDIGSHTHNHTICATQSEQVVREEMSKSKEMIEGETGRQCVNFCYPNGHFPNAGNEATDHLAKELGYQSVLYMMSAANLVHPDTFRLTGVAFGDETPLDKLPRTLSRLRFFGRRRRGDKIWAWEKDSI